MITENFIKQCEQAEEIQEKWRNPFINKFGDFYWRGKKYLMIPEACILNTDSHFIPEEEVFLPTLEQLFEMAEFKYIFHFLISLQTYYINRVVEKDEFFPLVREVKELLLSFIMYKKYNKIWTGEKWEAITC